MGQVRRTNTHYIESGDVLHKFPWNGYRCENYDIDQSGRDNGLRECDTRYSLRALARCGDRPANSARDAAAKRFSVLLAQHVVLAVKADLLAAFSSRPWLVVAFGSRAWPVVAVDLHSWAAFASFFVAPWFVVAAAFADY